MFDTILQTCLGVAALTFINRMIFNDTMIVAFGAAIALMAAFLLGRGSVKLIRRTIRGIIDK